jgi:hypothetical protein
MHKRPTYETLVKDTILNPKDEIYLPDRRATLLRNTQKLSQYDDEAFIEIEDENKNIMKEKMKNIELRKIISESTDDKTLNVEKATQVEEQDPKRGVGRPRTYGPKNIPKYQRAKFEADVRFAEYLSAKHEADYLHPSLYGMSDDEDIFDEDMDDQMNDQQEELEQAIEKRKNQQEEQKRSVRQQIDEHLGADSSTANQTFVNQLVKLSEEKPTRSRSRGEKIKPDVEPEVEEKPTRSRSRNQKIKPISKGKQENKVKQESIKTESERTVPKPIPSASQTPITTQSARSVPKPIPTSSQTPITTQSARTVPKPIPTSSSPAVFTPSRRARSITQASPSVPAQPKKTRKTRAASEDVQMTAITLNKSTDMEYWSQQSPNEMRAQITLRTGQRTPSTTGPNKKGLLKVIKSMIDKGTW